MGLSAMVTKLVSNRAQFSCASSNLGFIGLGSFVLLLRRTPAYRAAYSMKLNELSTVIGLFQKSVASWAGFGQPGQVHLGEPSSITVKRYQEGDSLFVHNDALSRTVDGYCRRATVLLYLNDVDKGGETELRLLPVFVRPRRGHALVFFPAHADGLPDARTLHEGLRADETKWIASTFL